MPDVNVPEQSFNIGRSLNVLKGLEELSNINVLPAVMLQFWFVAQGHLRKVYAHRQ